MSEHRRRGGSMGTMGLSSTNSESHGANAPGTKLFILSTITLALSLAYSAYTIYIR